MQIVVSVVRKRSGARSSFVHSLSPPLRSNPKGWSANRPRRLPIPPLTHNFPQQIEATATCGHKHTTHRHKHTQPTHLREAQPPSLLSPPSLSLPSTPAAPDRFPINQTTPPPAPLFSKEQLIAPYVLGNQIVVVAVQRLPRQCLGRHLDALVDRQALEGAQEGQGGAVIGGEEVLVGAGGEAVELLVAAGARRLGLGWVGG